MDKIKRIIFSPPLLGVYIILLIYVAFKRLIPFRKKRAKQIEDEIDLSHVI
jgi:hypothetical protein